MFLSRRDLDLSRRQIISSDILGLNNTASTTAEPIDAQQCELLGPTALVVQALLGVLVILSLVYKRHRESPQRKWRIWLFDVSKQILGQAFVHFTNVFIASLAGHISSQNPCAQYMLHIMIDTTLGVALLFVILKLFTYILSHKLDLKGFESGQYGSPPSLSFWGRQAAVYVVSLLSMKLLVLLLVSIAPFLTSAAEWMLSWLGEDAQVILVMGVFPVIMNILQFWIIDSIVKSPASAGIMLDDSPARASEQEPIFNADDDSDDDDIERGSKPLSVARPPPMPREHSYPPSGSTGSRPASPVPGAVAPPPMVPAHS
ncbi:vacuolar membrane protein-domain-containing protein [Auriculariales sp. MPI-PUGE-AT-0066]|nr:vacuolar membrane protein-domain-containing protein [Auriculariales sp. MPI-PUGE-AT-0066]